MLPKSPTQFDADIGLEEGGDIEMNVDERPVIAQFVV
jgi:hypothetical protein